MAVKKYTDLIDDQYGISDDCVKELSVLRRLTSPYLIQVLAVGVIDHHCYLAMELGQIDLFQEIIDWSVDHRPFDPVLVHQYTVEILRGVSYLHRIGLVHCDLKTSNVIIGQDHHLKLIDFGIAQWKRLPYEIQTHEIYTIGYRSVEHLLGDDCARPSSDLWAVGCLVAELVGRHPLFPDYEHPLDNIFQMLGDPRLNGWPGVTQFIDDQLLNTYHFNDQAPFPYPQADSWVNQVIIQTLQYSPNQRTPARILLEDEKK
jgi:cyclin-dependent kinase 8/11